MAQPLAIADTAAGTRRGSTDMADKKKTGMSQLAQQVNWALQNSRGGMGGMAAMMGMPFQQKTGNQWMTINPRRQSIYPSGSTPFGLGGYGGGMGGGMADGVGSPPQIEKPPLPPYDPNDPNENGGMDIQRLLELLKPPPIGTGAQWRNTMKYGA